MAGPSDGSNLPLAPETGEVPGRTVIDLAFGVVIERPILGFTHKDYLAGRYTFIVALACND